MSDAITKETTLTVGLDLGDRYIQVCVLDETGEVVEESRLSNRRAVFERRFGVCEPRIVLEAGTHSPWVSRLFVDLGHEVLVANPRKLRLIYKNGGWSGPGGRRIPGPPGPSRSFASCPLRHRPPRRRRPGRLAPHVPGSSPHPAYQPRPRSGEVVRGASPQLRGRSLREEGREPHPARA